MALLVLSEGAAWAQTAPVGHVGRYVGSNYGFGGRNLFIKAYRYTSTGNPILQNSSTATASQFRLYTSTGSFVKSGVWTTMTPGNQPVMMLQNITGTAMSYYVVVDEGDGLPIYHYNYGNELAPKTWIYLLATGGGNFNNWEWDVALPYATQAKVTRMGALVGNYDVHIGTLGPYHWTPGTIRVCHEITIAT